MGRANSLLSGGLRSSNDDAPETRCAMGHLLCWLRIHSWREMGMSFLFMNTLYRCRRCSAGKEVRATGTTFYADATMWDQVYGRRKL